MSMRIIADIFEYTSKNMPKFNSISISGYHMQEAGATADIELAYTLADGLGIPPYRSKCRNGYRCVCSPAFIFLGYRNESFHGNCQNARCPDDLGKNGETVQSEKSKITGITHSFQTSGWSLTEQDPFNNVARTCIEAMAAALGHTQILAHQCTG